MTPYRKAQLSAEIAEDIWQAVVLLAILPNNADGAGPVWPIEIDDLLSAARIVATKHQLIKPRN